MSKWKTRLRALAIGLTGIAALTTAAAVAPNAEALSWIDRPLITHHQYIDDCTSNPAEISVKLQWQTSSSYPTVYARLKAGVDITINNNTALKLTIINAQRGGGQGSIAYVRLAASGTGNYSISGYAYPGNNVVLPPHTTKTFSADNPDRWIRLDGVSDSDPSPAGTNVSTDSNPAIEFAGNLSTVSSGQCTAGGIPTTYTRYWNDEIAWDATR